MQKGYPPNLESSDWCHNHKGGFVLRLTITLKNETTHDRAGLFRSLSFASVGPVHEAHCSENTHAGPLPPSLRSPSFSVSVSTLLTATKEVFQPPCRNWQPFCTSQCRHLVSWRSIVTRAVFLLWLVLAQATAIQNIGYTHKVSIKRESRNTCSSFSRDTCSLFSRDTCSLFSRDTCSLFSSDTCSSFIDSWTLECCSFQT